MRRKKESNKVKESRINFMANNGKITSDKFPLLFVYIRDCVFIYGNFSYLYYHWIVLNLAVAELKKRRNRTNLLKIN